MNLMYWNFSLMSNAMATKNHRIEFSIHELKVINYSWLIPILNSKDKGFIFKDMLPRLSLLRLSLAYSKSYCSRNIHLHLLKVVSNRSQEILEEFLERQSLNLDFRYLILAFEVDYFQWSKHNRDDGQYRSTYNHFLSLMIGQHQLLYELQNTIGLLVKCKLSSKKSYMFK